MLDRASGFSLLSALLVRSPWRSASGSLRRYCGPAFVMDFLLLRFGETLFCIGWLSLAVFFFVLLSQWILFLLRRQPVIRGKRLWGFSVAYFALFLSLSLAWSAYLVWSSSYPDHSRRDLGWGFVVVFPLPSLGPACCCLFVSYLVWTHLNRLTR